MAREVGRHLATAGAIVVSGGRGGVMAAACGGAREAGGRTLGILPGVDPTDSRPNEDVEIVVYSGLGQARNLLVVLSAQAVVAISGGWGTLSEIALARKHDIPVVLLESWDLPRIPTGEDPSLLTAADPGEAVRLALEVRRTWSS